MHTLVDTQPNIADVLDLRIHHPGDWQGYCTVQWTPFKWPPNAAPVKVSIRAPWLLAGLMNTEHGDEIPTKVATRAVALAVADHAYRRVMEALGSISHQTQVR